MDIYIHGGEFGDEGKKWRKKWPRGGGNEGETGILSGFVGAVL